MGLFPRPPGPKLQSLGVTWPKTLIPKLPGFEPIVAKESWSQTIPFRRLKVKVKREIIRMDHPTIRPVEGRAPTVDAPTLARWLDQGHDDADRPVILLDTRNGFEVDHGGFAYDSDYYGDDLPFWMKVAKSNGQVVPHLVLPYTLDTNDMRFSSAQGFAQAEDFFIYLRDSFDALYAEGADSPKMMSVGMHCRLLGRPGRIVALQKFMDHIARHDRVWVCRRIDVAQHWRKAHPYQETP